MTLDDDAEVVNAAWENVKRWHGIPLVPDVDSFWAPVSGETHEFKKASLIQTMIAEPQNPFLFAHRRLRWQVIEIIHRAGSITQSEARAMKRPTQQ